MLLSARRFARAIARLRPSLSESSVGMSHAFARCPGRPAGAALAVPPSAQLSAHVARNSPELLRRQCWRHFSKLCSAFGSDRQYPQAQHDWFARSATRQSTVAFASSAFPLDERPGTRKAADTTKVPDNDVQELHAVNVAIGVNFCIFLAKMAAAYASGSSSLLAEGVHSLTDIGNQALLWFGILRSRREPTAEYPYGYMKDKFIFSLISAVGIFCLGAGASIFQGVSAALQPHTVDNLFYGFIVLAVSAVLEAFSLWVAVKTLLQGAKACGMRFFEYVRSGRDPTTISVLMEDGGAVAGLCIAGVCTALVQWTGNTIWDAVGSILVGLLLGAIAIWLIQRNRGMLIGRAMDRAQTRSILQHLKKDPVVKAVYDVRSEELGPGVYRFKADIDFEGEKVVERHLVRYGRERLYERLCAASWTDDSRAMDLCLMEYGRELVSAIGAEVDRIEAEIQHLVPGVQYVDLETDRGRYLELRQEHSRVRPSPAVRPHVLHRMLKPPLLPQEGPRPPPVAAAGSGVVPVSDLDCQTDAAPGSAASGNGSAAIPSQPPANGSSCSAAESVPSSDSSHPASTSGGGATPPGV